MAGQGAVRPDARFTHEAVDVGSSHAQGDFRSRSPPSRNSFAFAERAFRSWSRATRPAAGASNCWGCGPVEASPGCRNCTAKRPGTRLVPRPGQTRCDARFRGPAAFATSDRERKCCARLWSMELTPMTHGAGSRCKNAGSPSALTLDLSRAAKRRRLGRTVGPPISDHESATPAESAALRPPGPRAGWRATQCDHPSDPC